MLRLRVDPVDDDKIDDLLDKGWALEEERIRRHAGEETDREQSYMSRQEAQRLHGLCPTWPYAIPVTI